MADNNQLSFTDVLNRAFDEDSGALRVTDTGGSVSGTPTVTTAAPSTSPTLLVAANSARGEVLIVNAGAQTLYIYPGSSFTTSNGIPILAGAAFVDDLTKAAWYGLVVTGTGDARIVEVA